MCVSVCVCVCVVGDCICMVVCLDGVCVLRGGGYREKYNQGMKTDRGDCGDMALITH